MCGVRGGTRTWNVEQNLNRLHTVRLMRAGPGTSLVSGTAICANCCSMVLLSSAPCHPAFALQPRQAPRCCRPCQGADRALPGRGGAPVHGVHRCGLERMPCRGVLHAPGRKWCAADLVKALTERFPAEVARLFTGYIGAHVDGAWSFARGVSAKREGL